MLRIQIYLNPDNDAVWAEKESADFEESQEAINTARSLLRQVRPGQWRYNEVLFQGTVQAGESTASN